MEAEQNEYKKIGWNMGRMLKSRDLFVVEECLRSVLRSHEAPYWAYHAARDYAVRYDARYWSGLIPSSAPMVEEIAGFWRKYYGIKRVRDRLIDFGWRGWMLLSANEWVYGSREFAKEDRKRLLKIEESEAGSCLSPSLCLGAVTGPYRSVHDNLWHMDHECAARP